MGGAKVCCFQMVIGLRGCSGTALHALRQDQRSEVRRYYALSAYDDYYERFAGWQDLNMVTGWWCLGG